MEDYKKETLDSYNKHAEQFSEKFKALMDLKRRYEFPRFIDLREPFSKFSYYDNAQHGSTSIKVILPVLTGKDYDDLSIGDGKSASLAYTKTLTGKLSEAEIKKIRRNLEEYCGLDTEGMIWMLEKIKSIPNQG